MSYLKQHLSLKKMKNVCKCCALYDRCFQFIQKHSKNHCIQVQVMCNSNEDFSEYHLNIVSRIIHNN